jgi:hypothetical protein
MRRGLCSTNTPKLDVLRFSPWTLNENVGIANGISMFQMYGKDSRSSYWDSWAGLRHLRRHTPLARHIRLLYALV